MKDLGLKNTSPAPTAIVNPYGLYWMSRTTGQKAPITQELADHILAHRRQVTERLAKGGQLRATEVPGQPGRYRLTLSRPT
jgi:hypothetical protein